MAKKFLYTFLLALFGLIYPAEAFHIIGGDISYQCLGNDRYRFTMKIYRDCSNPRGDAFDARAPVTIYLGNGQPYIRFKHLYASIRMPVRSIPPDSNNPCLQVPPNICVEEGLYIFEETLPDTNMSYHIVYQRCCRNQTVDNILRPADIGATFSIEITPRAQAVCNSSPVFNYFPPVVICNNEPLEFDHSALDLDGDRVVYEFCNPLEGGGNGGTQGPGGATACDGFRPDPACPPPFDPVTFISPTYTAQRPMGGDPLIQIDPNTGLITGTPKFLGQYVVGVCATEYRNGEALSVIRRDFQFNVANCEPTVIARMQADEVIGQDSFIIQSCGNPVVNIQNQSFQRANIAAFRWEFMVNGQQELYADWSPNVSFPGPGNYPGLLVLNPNQNCGDTAFVEVRVFPELTADFEFDYDTCRSGPVLFTNQSFVNGASVTGQEWRFGDGSTSNEKNPRHLYRNPGTIPVLLRVVDSNGCEEEIVRLVDYFPVPSLIIVSPSDFVGCNPGTITFKNLSFPIDETYQIQWDFGDGGYADQISPTHTFHAPGIFDIQLQITSPIGCQTDTTFSKLIEIQPRPTANFIFEPSNPDVFHPEVYFYDQSTGAAKWDWLFEGAVRVTERHPVHIFRDTGMQQVRLVVTHAEGCKDTAWAQIDIVPQTSFYLPNAFSPNNDSHNDYMLGKGYLEGMRAFQLQVWNRWGELVFETSDPVEGWNGQKFNTREQAPAGVYMVLVRYVEPRGKVQELQQPLLLIR